jgi:uncharacterized repeat protein (TIGR01451 family)
MLNRGRWLRTQKQLIAVVASAAAALTFVYTPMSIASSAGASTTTSLGSANVVLSQIGTSGPASTKVDVLAELLSNGTPIASGTKRCVAIPPNTDTATTYTQVSVPLTSAGPTSGSNLAFRASVRIGTDANGNKCQGAPAQSPGLRLYYDSSAIASTLQGQITSSTDLTYYLHSNGTTCTPGTPSSGVTESYFDPFAPTATDAKCQSSTNLIYPHGNPWASLGTFDQAQPALTLTKSAAETDYRAVGDTLHYSYLITNTGNVTLHQVGVSDTRSRGLTGLTCPPGTLAPGANESCTATHTITSADMADGRVVNTATAQGTAPGAPTPTLSSASSVTVPVIAPPAPEPISVSELPLPPVTQDTSPGGCTLAVNPNNTGCISKSVGLTGDGFLPGGHEVIAGVSFVGAPAGGIYSGSQLILVKTDGTTFSNGDPWKCVTCGIPAANKLGINSPSNYVFAFPDGERILQGNNVVQCDFPLASDLCTPAVTHIYPTYFNVGNANGTGGSIREVVLSRDGVHIGFDQLVFNSAGQLNEVNFFGRLTFDPAPTSGVPMVPRYDITNVNLMLAPPTLPDGSPNPAAVPFRVDPTDPTKLIWNPSAIVVGETRGISADGTEVQYIGNPVESNNNDVFGANLITGQVRRISAGQQYVDPMDSGPGGWNVVLGLRDQGRMNFVSAMRGIPPLNDLITAGLVASIRNNGNRRFFQPVLIDPYGGRGSYAGQRINACTTGPCSTLATDATNGVSDLNWNALADPHFFDDGTMITYYQSLTTPPACGGANPLPCETSTEPGGRTARLMLARLTSRTPVPVQPVAPVGDTVPWAQPYVPGSSTFDRPVVPAGTYTLDGQVSGSAQVTITNGFTNGIATSVASVAVTYTNYSDDGDHIINGSERVVDKSAGFTAKVDWISNLTETGVVDGTKVTTGDPNSAFPAGCEITISLLQNVFNATGTLTTTIDGQTYTQPANGQ